MKWIKCSERLPEKDGHYFGIIKLFDVPMAITVIYQQGITKNIWKDKDNLKVLDGESEVVAWLQVPEFEGEEVI